MLKFKTKKMTALALSAVMSAMLLSGCGGSKDTGITIASWPKEATDEAKFDLYQGYLDEFKSTHPDLNVATDTWDFDLQTYLVRAAGKDLPTVFKTAPTELDTLIKSGYIKDITKSLEKHGYLEGYDKTYENVYMRDGKAYAIVDPSSVYKMGIVCNNEVFEKAGLVDVEGNPIFPQTWEELAETASVIKEKTGLPGFVLTTKGNHGGWMFMNIAYSYGVEFVKQDKDGKWKATFNTQECVDALQYIKDLKWKYNAIQDNALASLTDVKQMIGVNEAGMGIIHSKSLLNIGKTYGTDLNNLSMCRIPAGPNGRFAVSSADIYVINADATEEEVDAVFDWFNLIGFGPDVDEDAISTWEEMYKANLDEGLIVGIKPDVIWKDGERKNSQISVMGKYANVDSRKFIDYTDADDVNLKSDPEQLAQALYEILDATIQEVVTNKDADVKKLVEEAAYNFQVNHLDKE